jgi:hypothetical protein
MDRITQKIRMNLSKRAYGLYAGKICLGALGSSGAETGFKGKIRGWLVHSYRRQ